MSEAGDKTEKPTAKKKGELRKKGVATKSQEMPQAVSLLVLVVALPMALKNLTGAYSAMMATMLSASGDADLSEAGQLARSMLSAGLKALVVPVLLVAGTTILTNVVITRQKPNFKLIKPKFENISPKNGIKRVFSAHGLMETLKTTAKLGIVLGLGYLAYRRGVTHLVSSAAPLDSIISTTMGTTKSLLLQVAGTALMIGLVDVAWAVRRYNKQSKMSKQDVKEEAKQAEVNPEVKGAIRSKQMKMSRQRMMAAVVGADVVLVNPTHIAVALKYEPGSFAPKVVAKGAGEVALRIREKAMEAGVEIVRNVPLARALHQSCQLGDSIPVDLFRAVAEVLATVYATRRRRGGSFPQVPRPRDPESATDARPGAVPADKSMP